MDRAARVKICEKCLKRDYSAKKGIVCSLTGEHAAFEVTCPDYAEDEKEVASIKAYQDAQKNDQFSSEPFRMEKKALSSGILGGSIAMVIAVVWFFTALSFDRIFFYPPVLFIIGLIGVIKGIADKNKEMKKQKEDSILDSDL